MRTTGSAPRGNLSCRAAVVTAAVTVFLALPPADAGASLTLTSGLTMSRPANLVTNGSFETGKPADGVHVNWTTNPPVGWTYSGPATLAAAWGNDGGTPYRLKASDVLPDGNAGMFFSHGGAAGGVGPPPTFNLDGTVSFPGPPGFSTSPMVLAQKVNGPFSTAASYKLTFWVSAEEINTNQGNNSENILGFRMTDVLAGDPLNYLTVPNGFGPQGDSRVYEYTFTPLVATPTVDIEFWSWGRLNVGAGIGPDMVLDDVIINTVPEPATALPMFVTALIAVPRPAPRRRRHG